MSEKQKDLFITWETDLRVACHGHYEAAVNSSRYNYYLGIPVIILSTIVGTAIFASLEANPETYLQIIFGLLSMLSVVLASLQTFFKFSEKAEKHRKAGRLFGSLLKELEQKMVYTENGVSAEGWCTEFRERWDEISDESSTVPKKIWKNQIEKQLKRKKEKYG